MSHIYFAVYMVALLSGALVLPILYLRYRHTKAFGETFAIYMVLSLLVLLGACILYVAVNVSPGDFLFKIFVTAAFCNIAVLLYLLPRQHHQLFSIILTKRQHYLWLGLASITIIFAVLMWWLPHAAREVVVIISLASLVFTVIYCQLIYHRFYALVYSSNRPKIVATVLPLLGIGLGLLEGFVYGKGIVERGVILSLPVIYILHCASVWWLRDELFPNSMHRQAIALGQLTAKEREIVQAVVKGLSNKQIAANFNLSPSTVKNHLYAAFKKLGVTNRYALINGLAVRP
jgi:DNA-binding CsgD family transcriptional regulator